MSNAMKKISDAFKKKKKEPSSKEPSKESSSKEVKDTKEKDGKKSSSKTGKSTSKTSKTKPTSDNPEKTEPNHSPSSTKTTQPKDKSDKKKVDKKVHNETNSLTNNEIEEDPEKAIENLCNTSKKVSSADFDIVAVIGRGSFGKVMQVRHKETGQYYAMKTMRKNNIIAKNQVAHTRDEKLILTQIKHPFVINLKFAFQTKDKLYMIMDFINGGELFFHLKEEGRFDEERVRFYAAEISLALIHLHNHGIVYRDLKLENLLLDSEGHIVVTDFGLSKKINDKRTNTFCGTPEYLAPEVLVGQGQSFPVDWWSLGTVLYEMMAGLPPFYSENQAEMFDKIVNEELAFPQSMSDEACDFLAGLLEKDPEDRPLNDEILSHAWFDGIDWDLLLQKKIKPPWRPPLKGINDRRFIDKELQEEPAIDSYDGGKNKVLDDLSEGEKDLFEGFTFDETANSTLNNVTAKPERDSL
eukprot:TRINITY_DN1731_c0_g1_i1.p1 TRINITY_DN1731_c0_g1~~TRINITY_DN1731_c0_g1_i1.p1  ORF type:complete len:468 (-),score=132.21 TRINITY_DN1731_c0_g1_i1:79-1482(-)